MHNVAHQESQFHADIVLPRNDKKEKYFKNSEFKTGRKYRKASSRDYPMHAPILVYSFASRFISITQTCYKQGSL
jgi:hypothetical protein